ncbi:MAG TPA: transcription antitermination factor NusB, partial [Burkholderiales bacterium]|nr:transcription antitermination factor NusB [Burkholderiales bacterium]
MIDSQRLASHAVLMTLEGRNLTQTLGKIWAGHRDLDHAHKGSIQDLSYGVLRYYGLLRAELDLLLKAPLKDRDVDSLLLVALYQLQYTHAPDHAIVNHAVEASRKSAKGLVNAVLRNFQRRKDELFERLTGNEVAKYNHPGWWIEKLKAQYPDNFREILEAGNSRPPMTLRINRRKTTMAEYLSIAPECLRLSESALTLSKPVPVEKLPGFSEGLVSVQDLGAQHAASLLDLKDGMRVLDACAAPG